jgi:4-phospho-D-threonate 3-dehydrogenase / 4-phospho-D-erythronate 3-dehydrogenase
LPADESVTMLPKVAVTMGDPAGIGPEICLHLLHDATAKEEVWTQCVPIVFGTVDVLRRVAEQIGIEWNCPILDPADWPANARDLQTPAVLNWPYIDARQVVPAQVDAACGDAAFQYVLRAIEAGMAGDIDAIATGPLNKEALHAAGHFYPGHTEIFAERMGAARSCMMQTSPEITCTFVTVHCGYREVPDLLTVERIVEVVELTVAALRRMRPHEPKLLVCGLNPHAGEHGLFGEREEERIIQPAIALCRERGYQLDGPVPPDTAFLPWRRREYDAVVCMYHDQGHIPLKALAFDSAINTTLGLPVIRTSVDHGTAFDIAWKGQASPGNLFAAVRLAARLATEAATA